LDRIRNEFEKIQKTDENTIEELVSLDGQVFVKLKELIDAKEKKEARIKAVCGTFVTVSDFAIFMDKDEKETFENARQIKMEQTKLKSMEKIRSLIAKGRLDQALTLLSEQYNSDEISGLQERLSTLTRDKRMGILTHSEASIERNKITIATLGLLTELADEAAKSTLPAKDQQAPAPPPTSVRGNQAPESEKTKADGDRGSGKMIYPKETSNVIEVVGTAPKFIPFKEREEKVKILFISATPSHAGKLNTGRESRFKDLFKYFDDENIFEWKEQHGVDADEFSNFLIMEEPHILHYGGHGEVEGIVLEKGNLEGDILRDMLEVSNQTQCVVLNACYSVTIAKKVAECVPYVIGTQGAINDKSAIAFARGFYMGIVAGYSIEKAFKLGLIRIRQKKLPDADIPILVKGVQQKEV